MTELLSDLNTTNLLNAIKANAYAFFIRRELLLGKAVIEEGCLTWIEGPSSPPVAWLHDLISSANIVSRVYQTVAQFSLRCLPEVYIVCLETGDCRSEWQSNGAIRIETIHAMIALPSQVVQNHLIRKGLLVKPVNDEAGLRDCAAVISAGRDQWTAGFFKLTNPSIPTGNESLRYYLALLEGKPVATATQFFYGGLSGIWWVTTVPELRKRGISTSIIRAAMTDASDLGYRAVMIEALPDSIHKYRYLGFQEYCRINVYRWRSIGERSGGLGL